MTLEIEGNPDLNLWIAMHPLAERSLEVMLEAMPAMHIAGVPKEGFLAGIVNLPQRQVLFHPDVPDPVVVYRDHPTSPKDEPSFVVGADGRVIDLANIENTHEHIGADELRKYLEGGTQEDG